MYMIMARISRVLLIPPKRTFQCNNNFFKLSFKSQTVTPVVRENSIDTKKKVKEQSKITIKDQKDKWMGKVNPQMRKTNSGSKSGFGGVGAAFGILKPISREQRNQIKEERDEEEEYEEYENSEPKINIKDQKDKWMGKVNPEMRKTNSGSQSGSGGVGENEEQEENSEPKINIKDQRDKWMAKMNPEMQRKKANINSASQIGAAGNSTSFGMPKSFQTEQRKLLKEEKQDEGSVSVTDSNKNWMNRMRSDQQQKQAQWVKDMQAKQQAGRDMQQQKMQQIKQVQPEKIGEKKPEIIAKTEAEIETEPEPKTPERLAYLEVIKQLNSYQIHEPAAGRAQSNKTNKIEPNIEHTLQCLEATGFEKCELENIPVIQVAGTKGRGSTCILVEAILRSHGIKTGVLSAPHLFVTSERIRIEGEPLTDVEFTELFLQLEKKLCNVPQPPSYNKLLTIMAFHAFRNANVDVAIVEIGSGCASDCTNITSHAKTIGISCLGWEQNFTSNNSMRDIAWAKAAIMKPEASIYTSATQTECVEVLGQRAKQLGVQLYRVPSYPSYIEANFSDKKLLNSANFSVRLNASLAIQLAYDYMRRYKPEYVTGLDHNATQLTPGATRGIETYVQRGQFEIMKYDMFNVYMDSADTLESMMVCREWFYSRTRGSRSPKVLLFNKVNEFNSKDLLTILRHNMKFEEAGFVPSPSLFEGESLDGEQDKATKDAIAWHGMEELQRARRNASNWRSLCEEDGTRDSAQLSISIESFFDYLHNKYGNQRYGMRNELDVLVTGSRQLVAGAISWLQQKKDAQLKKWQQ